MSKKKEVFTGQALGPLELRNLVYSILEHQERSWAGYFLTKAISRAQKKGFKMEVIRGQALEALGVRSLLDHGTKKPPKKQPQLKSVRVLIQSSQKVKDHLQKCTQNKK